MAITLFVLSSPSVCDDYAVNDKKAAIELAAKFADERPLSAQEQVEIDYLTKLAAGKTPTATEAMNHVLAKTTGPEPKRPNKSI